MGAHVSTESEIRVVMDSLRQIVRVLRVSSREAEKRAGISGAQLFVLQKLAEARALSVGELAGRTATDQSSVSVVVSRLEARALVTRETDERDARRVIIRLTGGGRALLRRSPEASQAQLLEALARLAGPSRRSLAKGLHALVREMRVQAPPPMFFEDDRRQKGRHAARP